MVAAGFAVDESLLTGESVPGRPEVGQPLYGGTFAVEGAAEAVATATGGRTRLAGIATLTRQVHRRLSPLAVRLNRVVSVVAVTAVAVGIVLFGLSLLLGLTALEGFLFALGVTVALVPEGLLPTVTLALALGTRTMAGRHTLVKRLEAVETLGSVTFICTDKTGTLRRWVRPERPDQGDRRGPRPDRRGGLLGRAGVDRAAGAARWHLARPRRSDGGGPVRTRAPSRHRPGVALPRRADRAAAAVRPTPAPVVRDRRRAAARQGRPGAGRRGLPADHRVRRQRVLAVACGPAVSPDRMADPTDLELLGIIGLLDPPRAEAPSTNTLTGRARTGELIDRRVLTRAFGVLGPAEVLASLKGVPGHAARGRLALGASPSEALLATASGTAFAAIVVAQLANAYACRSEARFALPIDLRRNPLLLGAIVSELVLLAVFLGVPPTADTAGDAPRFP